MNNRFTRFAPAILAVLLAAGSGVALVTLAQAQTTGAAPAPAPPMPPHRPMGPGGPGMHGNPMMREVERLKTSLKLTASQAALWDKAQGLMKPPSDMHESMKARRDRMAAMLDDPAFDPRRMAAEMDASQAERRARMSSVRDAWFAVYDSLNPVQRGQAREFLRSHMSRPHGMGDRMGWMHRHDDESGKPPMPPMSR